MRLCLSCANRSGRASSSVPPEREAKTDAIVPSSLPDFFGAVVGGGGGGDDAVLVSSEGRSALVVAIKVRRAGNDGARGALRRAVRNIFDGWLMVVRNEGQDGAAPMCSSPRTPTKTLKRKQHGHRSTSAKSAGEEQAAVLGATSANLVPSAKMKFASVTFVTDPASHIKVGQKQEPESTCFDSRPD